MKEVINLQLHFYKTRSVQFQGFQSFVLQGLRKVAVGIALESVVGLRHNALHFFYASVSPVGIALESVVGLRPKASQPTPANLEATVGIALESVVGLRPSRKSA